MPGCRAWRRRRENDQVTSAAAPAVPPSRLWRAAQGVGLLLTAALLTGLLTRPQPSLHVLWDMVIPLLPATFLLSPMLWRNVCLLATLNQLTGRGRGARLRGDALEWAWVIGIAPPLLPNSCSSRRCWYS